MKTTYVESQRFTQWWLWALLLGLVGLSLYGIYRQLFSGTPWGNNPMSDWGLVLFLIFNVGLAVFFYYIELRTEIDARGIRVRLRPFSAQSFPWDTIESVQLIHYGFVGYGLRLMTRYGTVYNTSGHHGLALITKDGGRYMIGTQNPEKVNAVLLQLHPELLSSHLYPGKQYNA